MAELSNWLTQTKIDKTALSSFITEIENYFSDLGFNSGEFEKSVEQKLKSLEDEVKKSLKDDSNAQS